MGVAAVIVVVTHGVIEYINDNNEPITSLY